MTSTIDGRPDVTASRLQARARNVGSPRYRVLLIETNTDGTVGGSYQALHDLAVGLAGSPYEPVVLFYQENRFADRLRELDIEVHVLEDEWRRDRALLSAGSPLRKAMGMLRAIAWRMAFLRRHAIDIVHVNGSPHDAHDDWVPAARLRRLPRIANAMGNVPGHMGRPWHRWLIRGYDHVIPCSRFVADRVRKLGYDDDRVSVVHLGIDLDRFRARVERGAGELRRELGIADGVMLLAMVGNLRHWKGQHVVLEALGRIDGPTRGRLLVLFIGACAANDQPYREELDDLVRRHGLEHCIRFLGPRTDVPDLVNAADVVLHASVRPEPFGLVVLEGMALGKPVVAAREGGPGEILDQHSGILYDPGDPGELADILRSLIDAPARREALGGQARRRVERFTVQQTVLRIRAIYERVLAGVRPARQG